MLSATECEDLGSVTNAVSNRMWRSRFSHKCCQQQNVKISVQSQMPVEMAVCSLRCCQLLTLEQNMKTGSVAHLCWQKCLSVKCCALEQTMKWRQVQSHIMYYIHIHVDEMAVESNAAGENTELWTAREEKILSRFTCMFIDMVFDSNVVSEWARN